ncbi:hypothetical protein BJ138DRAFT_1014364, partial [Hygrophoropsis aurantiaca]
MNRLGGPTKSGAQAAQNAPTALDSADSFQSTYLQPLKIFDSVISKIGDVHPYAKMALGVLTTASKIILAQDSRDQAVLDLLSKLNQVYAFLTQGDTLAKISSMRTIVARIAQLTLECAEFIRDYADIKNVWVRLGKNILSETNDKTQGYSDTLDGLMQQFRDQVAWDVAGFIHRADEFMDLNGIVCASGAGLITGKQCLPGTRAEILAEISGWINSSGDDVPQVLWLSGPAGKGKSAIAHTVAGWFENVGACYCFDRNRDADRRHEKIFSTIARVLADHNPEMRQALADVVRNDSALKTTTDIIQQWSKLLMGPVGKLSGSTLQPVVIVIDALDESGAENTRRDVLRILACKPRKTGVPLITPLPPNFRILVTSRPLADIHDMFQGAQHVRQMSLDDIPLNLTQRDIRSYISDELVEQRTFGNEECVDLTRKADGLFEWARLACEYIIIRRPGSTSLDRFKAIMSQESGEHSLLLDDMYHLILKDIMGEGKDPIALKKFHSVMGQILATLEPLPVASLNAMRHQFPDQEDCFDVELVVDLMGSLLSGINSQSPVRPLHVSFREFLTEKSRSQQYFVDVKRAQCGLAFSSLRVMEHGLRFNICKLPSSYLRNSEVEDLQERINQHIPSHLSYSCRFWATHVRSVDPGTELAKEVVQFFNDERLLFWIEALSLLKTISGPIAALMLVPQWIKGKAGYDDVLSTTANIQRFIQTFSGTILQSTPHLYISALPFLPVNSVLSKKFCSGATHFQNTLRIASGRDMNWKATVNILKGHTDYVTSVAF